MRMLILALMAAAGALALAQHNNRSARDLQFRFGNPGARSMGFGGAFIGLADDATAPVANPAGMTRTNSRSFAFELSYSGQDHPIPFQSGRIQQTNIFEFDFDLQSGSAPQDEFSAPYLAAIFPRNQWRFGFYAHQQADIERRYNTESILICDLGSAFYPDCENAPNPTRYPPSTDTLDMEMINAGASLAGKLGRFVSLGASVFFSDLDYRADSIVEYPAVGGPVQVNQFARGDDSDWGFTLGLLARLNPTLSFGAVFKRQPEFDYRATLTKSRQLAGLAPDFEAHARFKIPDSIGFGLTINPLETLTINLDVNRVFYSQITDELLDFTQVESGGQPVTQAMPDISEIHLGVEWTLPARRYPLSLRLGYWLEPYHAAVNNVEDSQILEEPAETPFVRDIFFLNRFEEDRNHYAAGLGWVFGAKLQLDIAVDISEDSEAGVVSGIYRF